LLESDYLAASKHIRQPTRSENEIVVVGVTCTERSRSISNDQRKAKVEFKKRNA